ncbi:MAG: SDR family oxidoreductase [Microbacteriaceae bacterium]|nr:SDR family oxidoreductase [Microbacteriaceae bacterium]
MTTLQNAVVLITGANGGLGEQFVAQGIDRGAAKVYASARSPRAWSDSRIVPLALDVTSAESIAAAAELAGDTTVLINNAGVIGGRSLLDDPLETIRATYATNVLAPIALTRAFAPALAANGGGAVVNVLSALSWLATPGAYSGTKAALWSVTNTLRLELRGQGTQVLGSHLGYTDTPMLAGLDVPKNDPAVIVAAIYDALEAGAHEVLADDTSRRIRAALSQPVEALYPQLA